MKGIAPALIAVPRATALCWPRRSSQPPAQRQREGERVGLLAVHPVQLEPGPGSLLEHLRAASSEVVRVAAADRHEAGQPNLAVPRGQLRLPSCRGLFGLALARGFRLAESTTQLSVGQVTGDRGLD